MTKNYRQLERRFHRLGTVNQAAEMLHWDMAAMMPSGGHGARAEQLATLSVIAHEILAAPETDDLLAAAGAEALDDWQRANLGEMRRLHAHATALDAGLVEALARARSAAERAWREARPKSDYALVKPHLAEVLNLSRQSAAAKAEKLGLMPYEALMDEFEPGIRTSDIDPVFAVYADFLPGFLARVLAAQAGKPKPLAPSGPFPIEKQKALAERIMASLGFDFAHGRLDTSLHPFCGGVPDDVRITTRYAEDGFTASLMGVIHETGHALYERGLPPDWRTQPVGRARGMAIHESQSLLIEMQAARSPSFCRFLSPLLAETFPGGEDAFRPDNLARLYAVVRPGFIRVDADEVTYPAHVILRYRLEQALIAGDLSLDDLPAAWNAGMQSLLGITPPSDREGCLQDIHWFEGAFGYFPCYSLGAMIAAQLFEAAVAAEPGIPEAIARGDFAPLVAWLGRNVHGLGSSLSTPEIVRKATGKPLDASVFRRHLERRYLS